MNFVMALDDIDYDDSTVHLYESLKAREDFTEEFIDELISQAVSDRVRQIFNNKEELAKQAQNRFAVEEQEGGEGDDSW